MRIIALLLASVEASKLATKVSPPEPYWDSVMGYGDEAGDIAGIDVHSLADSGLVSQDVAWDYDFAVQNLNAATEAVNDELNGDDEDDYGYHYYDETDFDWDDSDDWDYSGDSDDYGWDLYEGIDVSDDFDWDQYYGIDDSDDWDYNYGDIDYDPATSNYVDMATDATHYIDPVTGEYVAYDTADEDSTDGYDYGYDEDSNDWDMDSTAGWGDWGSINYDEDTSNYVDMETDATHYLDPITGQYVAYEDEEEEVEHVAQADCNLNEYTIVDSYGDTCSLYWQYPDWCGNFDTDNFNSMVDCCACLEL